MHACNNKLALVDAIREMAQQPYGWGDSQEGLPMRPDVLETATRFVFTEESPLCLGELDEPQVTLNEDGTLEVVFDNGDCELILTFLSRMVVGYIKCFEDGKTQEDAICRIDKPRGVKDLMLAFEWIGATV